MAEGILLRAGGGSLTDLNALPSDVLDGKSFVGASGEIQEGEMVDHGEVSYALTVNEEYTIQEGYYDSILVTQSVPTQGNMSYSPSSTNTQIAEVAGKYMTGDITVSPISNLLPGNIKKGVTIGGVTGTWEGYL